MNKRNYRTYFIIGFFVLVFGGLVSTNFYMLNKAKTQISNGSLSTQEYSWYFNPRNDGKQPDPIKEANFFNIVGQNIIDKAIDCKLLPKEGIRVINGIPMALKMMF